MQVYGRLVTPGEPLQQGALPLPALEGRQVLVRVLASGLCHSDLHLAKGELGTPKWGAYTLGHEGAGLVQALGPECSAGLRVGQLVGVYPWLSGSDGMGKALGCGLDGLFASHVVVPDERLLVAAPEGMSPEELALLACSGVTAYSALTKAGMPDTLVIIG